MTGRAHGGVAAANWRAHHARGERGRLGRAEGGAAGWLGRAGKPARGERGGFFSISLFSF
jgi:hypothetical protein